MMIFPLLIIVILLLGSLFYQQKIVNSFVLGVSISRLTPKEAADKLANKLQMPEEIKVFVNTPQGEQNFEIPTNILNTKVDYYETAQEAYLENRQGGFVKEIQQTVDMFFNPSSILPKVYYSQSALDEQISLIAGQVFVSPQYPNIAVDQSKKLEVTKGSVGWELDLKALTTLVKHNLEQLSDKDIHVQMQQIGRELTDGEVLGISTSYDNLLGKSVDLKFEDYSYKLDGEELIKFVSDIGGSEKSPRDNLADNIADSVDRDPVDPVFQIKNGRVVEFKPSINGVKVNKHSLLDKIDQAISQFTSEDKVDVEIPTSQTEPNLKTSDINNYGIKELIGSGSSTFQGSVSDRIHNIGVASSKLNGVLVAPGEVFSFTKTVGDISVLTGYKQSYVIQGNQTVLGDGGGVCQVSTTLFRAALNAGLPIVERRPHSYRVGYYEQGSAPGIDATIYSPSVDFKFKNDTGNYILIQTLFNPKLQSLKFEFYGTKDGRVATISKPVVTEVTPPPEDQYIDDPSKPTGYIEQVDWKAWGAKVNFDYNVVRDGKNIFSKTFYSNYRPWQAKFIRGTGPN